MPETRDTYREWLASLKPGDRVYSRGRLTRRVGIVERITKTLVVLNDKSQWTAHPHQSYSCLYLENPADHEREIILDEIRRRIGARDDDSLTTDQLRDVAKILGIEVL